MDIGHASGTPEHAVSTPWFNTDFYTQDGVNFIERDPQSTRRGPPSSSNSTHTIPPPPSHTTSTASAKHRSKNRRSGLQISHGPRSLDGHEANLCRNSTLNRVSYQAGSSQKSTAEDQCSPKGSIPQDQTLSFSSLLDFFNTNEGQPGTIFRPMTASPSLYVDDDMSQDMTSSTSSIPTKRPAKQARAAQKRNRIGTPHGEDGDGDYRMSGDDTDTKKPHDGKSFACPYYRNDPLRHLDCMTLKLNRIPDVKQHLKRRHTPSHACWTCSEGFSDEQTLQNHLSFRNCVPRTAGANIDGVSPKAQQLLKNRIDRRLTQKDQWYKIWKILFEDPNMTQDPHLNNVVEEVIGIIRNFCKNDGQQLVSGYVQRQGLPADNIDHLHPLLLELLDEVQLRFQQKPHDSILREPTATIENSPREVVGWAKPEPVSYPTSSPATAIDGCYSPSLFDSVVSTPPTNSSAPSSIVSEPDYHFLPSGMIANVPRFNGPQIQSTTSQFSSRLRVGRSSIDDRAGSGYDGSGDTPIPSSPAGDFFRDFLVDL